MENKSWNQGVHSDNNLKLWALTTLIPVLFVMVNVLFFIRFTSGDYRLFFLFMFPASIPLFLSFWALSEAKSYTGLIFLKAWRNIALTFPMVLFGFGTIFIINKDVTAVSIGVVSVAVGAYSFQHILSAYKSRKVLLEETLKAAKRKIRKNTRMKKDRIDKENLKRREEEVVKRAMERMGK